MERSDRLNLSVAFKLDQWQLENMMSKTKALILILIIAPILGAVYAIVNDQLTYTISEEYYTQKWNGEKPMLERKLAYPDSTAYIPYTMLCFIDDAELPNESGWILDFQIKTSEQRSLVVIEMNSSEMKGYEFSAGSVQLLLEVPKFQDSFQFDMHSNKIKVHLINNYGGIQAIDEHPIGNLILTKVDDKVEISGKVTLTTSSPATKQVVEFDEDLIPNWSLADFLKEAKQRTIKREEEEKKLVKLISESFMQAQSSEAGRPEKRMPGQNFKLTYSTYGLGSNFEIPSHLIVVVEDSILKYGVMELSSEVSSISFATGDTTFKEKRVWYQVPFSSTSKESILKLMAGKEGQHIFYSDPDIISGSVKQIYVEHSGWCTDMDFMNVYHKTESDIVHILNPYLPAKYKLYESVYEDWYKDESGPLIEECLGERGGG